jgi:hypothetical protein
MAVLVGYSGHCKPSDWGKVKRHRPAREASRRGGESGKRSSYL